jgi:sRNA-binding regulator protein Hfq
LRCFDPPHAAQADFGASLPIESAIASPCPLRPDPSLREKSARPAQPPHSHHFAALDPHDEHGSNNQAELFYLQKQIQLQTQMVFILEDGVRVQGVIEWYDRNSIKVRGKSRVLLYKSAVKYLFKAGEVGSAPE